MITHSILPISGSITKLQILNQKQLSALNNVAISGSIAFADIVISGTWEDVELTPDAGYKLKAMDSDNGPMQTIELGSAMMNDDSLLFAYLYNRYIALVTDGDGKRFLFGNKIENLKFEYEIDSKNTRGQVKTTSLMLKGATVKAVLLVL